MNFKEAQQFLAETYPFPPQDARQARNLLRRYHCEPHFVDQYEFKQRKWREWYDAVSVLTCMGMGKRHRNDPKRRDREFGQTLRVRRAGSRRG